MKLPPAVFLINIPHLVNLLLIFLSLVVLSSPPEFSLVVIVIVDVFIHLLRLLIDLIATVQFLFGLSPCFRVEFDIFPINPLTLIMI